MSNSVYGPNVQAAGVLRGVLWDVARSRIFRRLARQWSTLRAPMGKGGFHCKMASNPFSIAPQWCALHTFVGAGVIPAAGTRMHTPHTRMPKPGVRDARRIYRTK